MAHVADNFPPHSLVAMPPHAWSTEPLQHSNSTSNRLSLPAYPTTSSVIPHISSWNSSHQDSNTYQLHPPPPSSDLPSTDPTDHFNADTIFRDLLNLRIANDSSPDTTPSLQPPLTLHNNPMPTQVAPHPSLLHQDLFAHSDPDTDHLDIPDQYDHAEQSLKHFPSHLSSLPFLQHHIHHNPHDPSLSDPLSLPHRAPFPSSHPPYPSTHPIGRRHSSQGPLLRSSSVSDQTARSSNPSRSHPTSLPLHSGPRIKNDLYKTEICRSFAENAGFCKYGSKCQFAHGEEELRPVRRHPRYKTKLCRNFVNNGSCPYDTRCRFIHANDLPFVSVPALSGLHQSCVSTAPPSDTPDHARYEVNNVTSEEYTDHLRRILSMTPGSSAASVSASGETSIPLSSPHASPPAEAESGHSSLNTSNKLPDHITYGGQAGTQNSHIVPADHVYHARADVFRNYPDSAFGQPYMPLVPVSSESALGSTARDDVVTSAVGGSLQEARVVDNGDLNVFRPAGEVPVSEPFGSEVKATAASNEKMSQAASTNETLNLPGDGAIKEPVTNSAPSKGTRGRLPVFRNITSDGDSV